MMAGNKNNHKSNQNPPVMTTPVAIIGMASLFPGAKNLQQYWDNILNKVDCITEVPSSRWEIEDYYHSDPNMPDKTYCKMGGFIPDIDFDPSEFGLPPNILEATDVSQLLALSIARDALEDAGYGEEREFDRQRAGVILGVVGISMKLFSPMVARLQYPVWEKALKSHGLNEEDTQNIIDKIKLAYSGWEENTFPGIIGNVIAGRIANRFNLGGTNCTIDAACGSSLAAVKTATGELIQHRADLMITGGVDLDNSIGTYLCFSKTPAFSKKGHIRPFDANADGMLAGEGIGMLVLKRLADAENDGDRIYGVIKGIGSSSDGRFKSIYAPRAEGQATAVRRAYQEAGFDIHSISLLEAHGTGTLAGDPEEVKGFLQALGNTPSDAQTIALGSVKSQIGHTKATAGTASLIKTTLALHHKILPPTINVEKINPKLGIEDSPLYINSETRPWIQQDDRPRRAGVSAFGFGGTNFHVALEEYSPEHEDTYRRNSVSHPIILSANNPAALAQVCGETMQKLKADAENVFLNELAEKSCQQEIPAQHARIGFVAGDPAIAVDRIQTAVQILQEKPDAEEWEHPKGIFYRKSALETDGRVVALFSGQGSQYLNMGSDLALNFPEMRNVYRQVDLQLLADGSTPVSQIVYPTPVFDESEHNLQKKHLQNTENAQPAIGAFSVCLFKILESAGFKADFSAGHSFGELGALWAAGVLSDEDYFYLIKERGKAMASRGDGDGDHGTMIAIKGNVDEIRKILEGHPEITLANWNSNRQVVLAGKTGDIEKIKAEFDTEHFSVIPLPVSAAFHTGLVAHAQKPFAEALKKVQFHSAHIPVYSNATGKAHAKSPSTIRKNMLEHMLNPVLFKDEIENIYEAGGRIFIEFGPKSVACNLVKEILSDRTHVAISLNGNAKKNSDLQLREAYTFLKVTGLPLKNFDPYQLPNKPASRKKKMSVILNGGLYRSEKTRSAFQKALEQNNQITTPPTNVTEQNTSSENIEAKTMQPTENVGRTMPTTTPAMNVDQSFEKNTVQIPANGLMAMQEELARQQTEYTRTYSQLMLSQMNLVKDISTHPDRLEKVYPLLEKLEQNLDRINDMQQAFLDAHGRLTGQFSAAQNIPNFTISDHPSSNVQTTDISHSHASINEKTPTAPVDEPVQPLPHNNGGNGYELKEITTHNLDTAGVAAAQTGKPPSELILEIVSEKTGYPADMLEPDMDMEADLGIDSIKRVEIIGAIREIYPALPQIEPEQFSEIRTLQQIITFVSSKVTGLQEQNTSIPETDMQLPTPSLQKADSAESPNRIDGEAMSILLMNIVSEKTGYPVEMLEPDMDMEADLGIDSIKRVEIIGALRETYPDLPKVEPEQFNELRTLNHIIEYLAQYTSNDNSGELKSNTDEQPHDAAGPDMAISPADAPLVIPDVTIALQNIVSEKTGYPVEMLEPDMDMEADLGIDSIKRVEIIGAMREQFPDLPKVEPEQFSELRTIQQVADFIRQALSAQPVTPTEDTKLESHDSPSDGIITRHVTIKSLPAPDFMDIEFPAGHICLITDDGTELTSKLAKKLSEEFGQTIVLSFPQDIVGKRSPLPEDSIRIALEDMQEMHLQQTLTDISSRYGEIDTFIHLNARNQSAPQDENIYSETQKKVLKHIFLMAKHLKKTLNESSHKGRKAFMTVTHLDGYLGLGSNADYEPVEGGLFGLVKTLNLEWETVFCRAVDFARDMEHDETVQGILAELHDPNLLLTEIGYNATGRCTLDAELEQELEVMA